MIRWGGSYVIIPLAAWIGVSYGRSGFKAVLFGSLLLPFGLTWETVRFGMDLDVYLIALLFCRIGASHRPLLAWVPNFRANALFYAAFIVLPVSVGFYGADLIESIRLTLGFNFNALFLLFLFALGMSGFSHKRLIITLAAATILGIVLEMADLPKSAHQLLDADQAELPLLGLTDLHSIYLRYLLDSPVDFLTGLGYFLGGRYFKTFMETSERKTLATWPACGVILLVSIIALGGRLNWFVASSVLDSSPQPYLYFMGSAMALILAGFMAGLLQNRRGIALVLGCVVISWIVTGPLSGRFYYVTLYMYQPLYVIAFGALAIKIRDRLTGRNTVLFPKRWVIYFVLLVVVLVSLLAETDTMIETVVLLLVGVVATVLALLASKIRKKLAGIQAGEHGGWLSLFGFLALAWLAWEHLEGIAESLRTLLDVARNVTVLSNRQLRRLIDPNLVIVSFIIPVFGWIFLGSIQGLMKQLPECIRDLRRFAQAIRHYFKHKTFLAEKADPDKARTETNGRRETTAVMLRLSHIVQIVRHCTLVVAIILPLLLLVIASYPKEGLRGAVKEFIGTFSKEAKVAPKNKYERPEMRVNPFLWSAALDYLGDKPIIEADPDSYTGKIRTDWFTTSQAPVKRRRLTIYIKKSLSLSSIRVYARQQEKRLFGIWVELDDDFKENKRMESKIFSRAKNLADKNATERDQ